MWIISPTEVCRNQAALREQDVHTPELFPYTVAPSEILSRSSKPEVFENFLVESVVNNRLWAQRCATADDAAAGRCSLQPGIFMGGEPSNQNSNIRGIFHLITNSESPFGRG
jgi:hypothetical protein